MLECEEITPQELLRQHMTSPGYDLRNEGDQEEIDDKSQINKCDICFKTFASAFYLRTHLKLHEKAAFKCDICLRAFKLQCYLDMHIERVHKKKKYVKCDVCGKTLFDQRALTVHMINHSDIRQHQCKVCDKTFKWKRNLDSHILTHTGEKNFECDVCGKRFNRSWSLKNHKYIHTNEKPYVCNVCDYACRDNSTLRKHEARHKGTLTIYNCTFCKKKYKEKWRLKTHIAEKHLKIDVSLYECDFCGKRMKEREGFKSHLNRLHYNVKAHSCTKCDHKTYDVYSMEQHMRRHDDARPFMCRECGVGFKIKFDLDRHRITHNVTEQHPCPECGRRFARKHRMLMHLKLKLCFNKILCSQCGFYIRKETFKSHVCSKRKVRKYICDYCSCRMLTKAKLAQHIQYKHMKVTQKVIVKKNSKITRKRVKRYICDFCNQKLMSKRKIILHLKEKHMQNICPDTSDIKENAELPKEFETPEEKNTEILKTILSINAKNLKRVPEDVFNMYIRRNSKAPIEPKILNESPGRLSKKRRKKFESSYTSSSRDNDASCERDRERPRRDIKVVDYKVINDGIDLSDNESDKVLINICGKKNPLSNIKINKVEANYGKYYKIKLNSVQCHVCYKLFQTKDQLTEHYSTHVPQNVSLQQNICPICSKKFPSHRNNNSLFLHMSKVHKLNINNRSTNFEVKDGKFIVKTGARPRSKNVEANCQIKEIEIVPSIKNLNRHKMLEIDKRNREKKVSGTLKRELVKTKTGYYVKQIHIPLNNNIENKNREKEDLTNDTYLEEITELSKAAKKEGRTILFPCNKCEKVCTALCGLKVHRRIHNINAKPFKPKVWKHKIIQKVHEKSHKTGIDKTKNKQQMNAMKSKIKAGIDEIKDNNHGESIDNIKEVNGTDNPKISFKSNKLKLKSKSSKKTIKGNKIHKKKVNKQTAKSRENKTNEQDVQLRLFYEKCIRDSNIDFDQFLNIVNEVDKNEINPNLGENSNVVEDKEKVVKVVKVKNKLNKFNSERQNKINELRQRLYCKV